MGDSADAEGRRFLRGAGAWKVLLQPLLDVIVALIAPVTFLYVYTRNPFLADTAVGAHLRVVLVALLAFAMARIMLAALLPARLARAAAAIASSAVVMLMLLYYTLVVIGLDSWGRVITWALIRSYAGQSSELAQVLGIPSTIVLVLLVCLYLVLLRIAWVYLRRFDWTEQFVGQASRRSIAALLVCGATACAIEVDGFLIGPIGHTEPLSLTFFPDEGVWDPAQWGRVRAREARVALLEKLEDEARAAYQPNQAADRKNVILIVLDALRADRMSFYGYGRQTTPNLDRLARAGVVRKSAETRSSCGQSSCGLTSISNSRYVHEFPPRPITLHEVLRRHGYQVHLILGGDHANFYDARQLYGDVDSFYDAGMQNNEYMNDDRVVLQRAAQLKPWNGTPVMLQFHFMSTHVLGRRHEEFARFTPAVNYQWGAKRDAQRSGNYYDNGVLQADTFVHELLETLRTKGYLDNALVVVTADHGESLGENGRYKHGSTAYEETLRIPLLLIAQGYKGVPFAQGRLPAAQVDIAPTVLRELAMPIPKTWSGSPLQDPIARAYTYFQQHNVTGLFDHRDPAVTWKYWIISPTQEEFAFNLTVDPGENVNAIANVPEALRKEWRLEYLRLRRGQTGAAAPSQ